MKKLSKKIKNGVVVLKSEGFVAVLIHILEKFRKKNRNLGEFDFLVKTRDVIRADWSETKNYTVGYKKTNKKRLVINWMMSPPGKSSGGHQNIYRFINFLEQAGHLCNIYLYTQKDKRTMREIIIDTKNSYPLIKAPLFWLDGEMDKADAIIATGWETAYPVFNSSLAARKLYFVQDFEPYFYPVGTEYSLAENTYKFGFFGITAGGWLAKKLHKDYGMRTDFFEFGSDPNLYSLVNINKRKEVFFYARPVTARRGFEMGILALEIFHKLQPDFVINLAGWDVSSYQIPFPYVNLKTLDLSELKDVYNNCAVALVLSLTNMSLLPLELLSCGTIPVVNDGENNRLVSDNKYINYSPNNPHALAKHMSELVSKKDLVSYAKKASESVKNNSWGEAGSKFVSIIEKELLNG